MPSRPNKPSIALLATPETSPSVLYGMYDVLLSVGAVYADMTTGKPEDCLIDVRIVATTDKPFRCFGNVLVERQEMQQPDHRESQANQHGSSLIPPPSSLIPAALLPPEFCSGYSSTDIAPDNGAPVLRSRD